MKQPLTIKLSTVRLYLIQILKPLDYEKAMDELRKIVSEKQYELLLQSSED